MPPIRSKPSFLPNAKAWGRTLQALFVAAACFFSTRANAQIIIRDEFTGGGDGALIVGRTPDGGNLPGGTWLRNDSIPGVDGMRTTLTAGFGTSPGLFGQHQSAGMISLSSFGAYLKPTKLTISADLSAGQVSPPLLGTAGAAANGRGIALGFFSGTGSQSFSQNLFTGLVVDAVGTLTLVKDPNAAGFFGAGSTILTPVPFGGAYNPSALLNLSYDVDTTTGAILNIHFGNSTANYTSLEGGSFFTGTATNFAGVYTSSEVAGTFAAADNFQVKSVPEPASMSLVLVGGLWVLAARRKRCA